GVAGSPVLPTTRIGGAPFARTGAGLETGGTGQKVHGRPSHVVVGPKWGATLRACSASCSTPIVVAGDGPSTQPIAYSAAVSFEYVPPLRRSVYWSESRSSWSPVPRAACASAEPRSAKPFVPSYSALTTAMSNSPGPSVRDSPSTLPG